MKTYSQQLSTRLSKLHKELDDTMFRYKYSNGFGARHYWLDRADAFVGKIKQIEILQNDYA